MWNIRKEFRRNGYAERLMVCRRIFERLGYVTLFFQEWNSAARIYWRRRM